MTALNQQQRSRVTVRSRPSDFSSRGVYTICAGCGCSCCCLHWIGAGVGALTGFRVACQPTAADDAVPSAARLCISYGINAGVGISVLLFFITGSFVTDRLMVFALLPSLVLLPVAVSTLIGGAIGRALLVGNQTVTDEQRNSVMPYAWRLSWLPFAVATLLSGLGYLLMLGLAFAVG